MSKVIICRGLPASGKSTWARQWVNEDPEHRVRINQDDIRLMLGKYWVPERESLVSEIHHNMLVSALNYNYDIVIDNTNLNEVTIGQLKVIIEAYSNKIEYKDFFDTPLSECIKRDSTRELKVTEKVIRGFYNRYKNIYPLNGN